MENKINDKTLTESKNTQYSFSVTADEIKSADSFLDRAYIPIVIMTVIMNIIMVNRHPLSELIILLIGFGLCFANPTDCRK